MERSIISDLIKGNRPYQYSDIETLRALVEKYPYAQLFVILFLKALAENKSLEFDVALTTYAYRVTDRMKLYEIIHQQQVTISNISETITDFQSEETSKAAVAEINQVDAEIEEIETIDLPVVDLVEEELEVENSIETEVTVDSPEISIQDITEENIEESSTESIDSDISFELDTTDEIIISEESDEIEEQISVASLVDADNELSLNILSSVIESVYPQLIDHDKPSIQEEVLESNEDQVVEEIVSDEISDIEETEIEPEEQALVTEDEVLPTVEPQVVNSYQSFSSWLTGGSFETDKSEEKTLELSEEEPKSGDENEQNFSKKPDEKKTNELINEFIEKEPSISRPKKEFFSPSKKAKESVDESGLIYSETLANIYMLQGNFLLALKAYEHLYLTNPEKKAIFAKKIEELKQKIQNLK